MLPHTRMQEIVALVLAISGDIKPLGKNWVNTSIKRNSQVASLRASQLSQHVLRMPSKQKSSNFITDSILPENDIIFNNEIFGIWVSMVLL
jgi:hypothetical protein